MMFLYASMIILIINTLGSSGYIRVKHHPKLAPSGRIIGGKEVDISKYPYQVSLEYYGDHHCGGAILDNSTVITAAHCTYGIGAGAFKIRAGTSTLGKGGVLITVKSKFEHPSFDHWTYDNDVCILKLQEPLTCNDKIKPIASANEDFQFNAQSYATVSGWGSISAVDNSLSQKLRAVNVSLVDSEVCSKAYIKMLPITERMLCAGETGKDACHGDSGGPLVQDKTLVGIVSWGKGCGDSNYYGVYSRISKFHSYIKQYVDESWNKC